MKKKATKIRIKKPLQQRLELIPLLLVVCILPLVVRLKVLNYPKQNLFFEAFTNPAGDFFSYYKSVVLIVSAVLALLLLCYSYMNKTIKLKDYKPYYPIAIYSFFVLLSWITSKYFYTATFGYFERFEGALVLLSYMVMMIYAYITIENEKQLDTLYYFICGFALIFCLIGLSQFLKHDVLQTEWGKKLITPKQYWDQLENISFSFVAGQVYGTLYNINYTGSYMVLIFPLFVYQYLTSSNKLVILISAVMAGLSAFNLFASKSSGGMVALIIVVIVMIILLNKKLFTYWLRLLPVIIIAIGVVFMLKDTIYTEVSRGLKIPPANTQTYPLKDISMTDQEVNFTYNGETLKMILKENGGQLVTDFYHGDQPLELDEKDGIRTFKDEAFKTFSFKIKSYENEPCLSFTIDKKTHNFVISDNKFYYLTFNGYKSTIETAPTFGFKGRERFGSSRGYIWSRSLPMIKDTLLIGHGPDTYIYYFPHTDFLAKIRLTGWSRTVVDKPHNLYIATAINTGLLSLVALLVLFIGYIIQSLRLYLNTKPLNHFSAFGSAIFLGVMGFLITGLVNDSNLSISPMFWTLLGVGMACNYIYKNTVE